MFPRVHGPKEKVEAAVHRVVSLLVAAVIIASLAMTEVSLEAARAEASQTSRKAEAVPKAAASPTNKRAEPRAEAQKAVVQMAEVEAEAEQKVEASGTNAASPASRVSRRSHGKTGVSKTKGDVAAGPIQHRQALGAGAEGREGAQPEEDEA